MIGQFPVWFGLFWFAAGAAAAPRPTVTVRVANLAGVPEKTLWDAERMAGQILGKAGIAVNWDGGEESAADIRIQVLPGRPGSSFHGDAAGFAVLAPARDDAGVFYPVVLEAAQSLETDQTVILGAALAHEMGHLLLRSGAHSRLGVMRAHLGAGEARMAARGELLFTDEEAKGIRAEVARRHVSRERQ